MIGKMHRTNTPAPDLSGAWLGKWNDSRKEYNGSGGEFSCEALPDGAGGWNATFSIGKSMAKGKLLKAALRGKLEAGALVFDTSVNLGEFYGVYQFKGRVTSEIFSGEYSGPGEKGTFTMTKKSN